MRKRLFFMGFMLANFGNVQFGLGRVCRADDKDLAWLEIWCSRVVYEDYAGEALVMVLSGRQPAVWVVDSK